MVEWTYGKLMDCWVVQEYSGRDRRADGSSLETYTDMVNHKTKKQGIESLHSWKAANPDKEYRLVCISHAALMKVEIVELSGLKDQNT